MGIVHRFEGIILDLREPLATRNLKAAAKLLDIIARRYSAGFSVAKESIGKAEQKLREVQ